MPQNLDLPRAKRLKIAIACQSCRSKKVKCDGVRPVCGHCQKRDVLKSSCLYFSPGANEVQSPIRPPSGQTPPSTTSGPPDGTKLPSGYCDGLPGIFAGIDARLGLPPEGKPSLLPMTNAPLFGLLHRRQVPDNDVPHVDNVLPPRKYADYLMAIYWRYIQPLEPLLAQERFSNSYQALFAGTSLDTDERIFLSSLNTVFALSTQLQESLQPEQRDEASSTYFHRAWALLRPETIIWEPGSIELVRCLLLMSRYLQCTNNPHQTWMAVGSAVRIAQSLGLHIPEPSSSSSPSRDTNLKRQLWQCCVFMDRGISWTLGRTSTLSLTVAPVFIKPLHENGQQRYPCELSDEYFNKVLELYEISTHIMLSQAPSSCNISDSLGLPRFYKNEKYLSTLLKLDVCLHKWEKSLPQYLRLDVSESEVDDVSHRQAVILRLRLLHARIHLFRPILARVCLLQPQATTTTPLDQSMGDRLIQDCPSLCVDSAQKMIALVNTLYTQDDIIGILPWWHRVFYLHVAGTILIASMLRADLFTPIVAQSWDTAMMALRAHEHLSPFIQQCAANFQTLSSKITESHHLDSSSQLSPSEGPSNTYFQDIFHDVGFDPDNLLFSREDMTWFSNFELN